MDYLEQLRIFLDIIITSALLAFVGFERETAHKPAGLRTNMIVGGASCLIVSIIPELIGYVGNEGFGDIIQTDPIRVVEAILVGIGFIGAGTVMKSRGDNEITGLTTAATILYSCGIGITVAIHLYVLAITVTILIIIINYSVNRWARHLVEKKEQ
ncbi:MAG: MgtC/SapB family protein [Candidatus Cyclobacteriaceae bacterium M2_1C_046]